jgi:hypothetical protein
MTGLMALYRISLKHRRSAPTHLQANMSSPNSDPSSCFEGRLENAPSVRHMELNKVLRALRSKNGKVKMQSWYQEAVLESKHYQVTLMFIASIIGDGLAQRTCWHNFYSSAKREVFCTLPCFATEFLPTLNHANPPSQHL